MGQKDEGHVRDAEGAVDSLRLLVKLCSGLRGCGCGERAFSHVSLK